MNRYAARLALFAAVATAGIPTASFADHNTALVRVASELGFAYGYLGPEDAVSLSRPGVTVVIRPGERLFDVNDRTESVNGPAPHFWQSDVYVSDELVNRLRQIAARYPAVPGSDRIAVVNPNSAGAASISGSITKLNVVQTLGDQTLTVVGNAPANIPVTLTLFATFSNEIPNVVLSRRELLADSDGTFKTTIPVASGYFRGGFLTLEASSVLPGIKPAKSRIDLKPVNDKVIVPADQTPRNQR